MSEAKKFTDDNAQKVANALLAELTQIGLYARSKNDFYEFALYTLDKYSSDHFFSQNSNEQNARLLKVSETRVKAAKKSISVKFMEDDEYEKVFEDFVIAFAKEISEKGDSILKKDENATYKMMIDNPILRSVLSAKVKEACKTTFDFHFNTEIVSVSQNALIEMFSKEAKKHANAGFKELLDKIVSSLKKNKIVDGFKETLALVVKVIPETVSTVMSFVS